DRGRAWREGGEYRHQGSTGGDRMTPLAEAPMQKERATTIYEKSKTGRRAAVLPDAGVPETPIEDLIPANLLRSDPPNRRETPGRETSRHYNRLSRRNFDLDSGF